MASRTIRLARVFTPEYVRRVNAQIVHPAQSQVVKPNELESALARPLYVSRYEPERPVEYLAATLSYGLIKGTSRVCRVALEKLNELTSTFSARAPILGRQQENR